VRSTGSRRAARINKQGSSGNGRIPSKSVLHLATRAGASGSYLPAD
jgi:hypothetical protein